jgi:hypothetical protein
MPAAQWLGNPVAALESTRTREDALLYPVQLCDSVVLVSVGSIPESVSQLGTALRDVMYGQVLAHLLGTLGQHILCAAFKSKGSSAGVLELQFKAGQPALAAKFQLVDAGICRMSLLGGLVDVPISLGAGYKPAGTVTVVVAGLPPCFKKQGVVAALLGCAGYTAPVTTVVHEHFGQLKSPCGKVYANVGHSNLVAWVAPPADDHNLAKLPTKVEAPGLHVSISVAERPAVPAASEDMEDAVAVPADLHQQCATLSHQVQQLHAQLHALAAQQAQQHVPAQQQHHEPPHAQQQSQQQRTQQQQAQQQEAQHQQALQPLSQQPPPSSPPPRQQAPGQPMSASRQQHVSRSRRALVLQQPSAPISQHVTQAQETPVAAQQPAAAQQPDAAQQPAAAQQSDAAQQPAAAQHLQAQWEAAPQHALHPAAQIAAQHQAAPQLAAPHPAPLHMVEQAAQQVPSQQALQDTAILQRTMAFFQQFAQQAAEEQRARDTALQRQEAAHQSAQRSQAVLQAPVRHQGASRLQVTPLAAQEISPLTMPPTQRRQPSTQQWFPPSPSPSHKDDPLYEAMCLWLEEGPLWAVPQPALVAVVDAFATAEPALWAHFKDTLPRPGYLPPAITQAYRRHARMQQTQSQNPQTSHPTPTGRRSGSDRRPHQSSRTTSGPSASSRGPRSP